MKKELYDFEAEVRHVTDKAVLLDIGGKAPVWFAKAHLEEHGDGTFTVPMWLAIEKEIV